MPKKNKKIRRKLAEHLDGGQAYAKIEDLLDAIPFEKLGIRPSGLPYSFYEQFWHLNLAQKDIVEFTRDPDYKSPHWPDGYWPMEQAPTDQQEWEEIKEDFFETRKEFRKILLDKENYLTRKFDHGTGQNLIREALLVLEHNAYHTGQLLLIARLLKVYPS
ncbi:DinB family protein [Balneola sp. MJW-20]|uniref:DinB family protein n=1 Tax=Gracilimonas aurantiaca TaxID=3234185 RepID=UPI00346732A1